MIKKFQNEQLSEQNQKWSLSIQRESDLYVRPNEVRSDFFRDYNRILHCTAYRRLKHKTQVFFAARNDHICTRIEHVGHVASVSYTIANELGLNTELTNAIALGHDLGHAPFGHAGEGFLKEIIEKEIGETFWHEKNSLHFVDDIETLRDAEGNEQNLWLTYAVRDGIICHCGEVNENSIRPRDNNINLNNIKKTGEVAPFTWEGCIVKIADKISYLGRDIEDAITLKILSRNEMKKLLKILWDSKIKASKKYPKIKELTNTYLMHNFIVDLCESSNPKDGIRFSDEFLALINDVKAFNYEYIYNHKRLDMYKKFAQLIINSIFEVLVGIYKGNDTLKEVHDARNNGLYATLLLHFEEWLFKYVKRRDSFHEEPHRFKNKELYDLENIQDYKLAVIDFISGMMDML